MKKLILSAAVALCAASAWAVSAEDVRIYINPGHGSWTSNDRPMGTVKHGGYTQSDQVDTTGFFETNTNLKKAFALFYKLKEMGVQHNGTNALDLTQNIVMSHIQAGPYPPYNWDATANDGQGGWIVDESTEFNRNLSEIAAEVEFNNFDMFVSIHSNAATEGTNTNYPLLLYRGTDTQEGNAGSKAMGQAVWPHLFGLGHQQWTYYSMTNMNVRGDHSFYGSTSKVSYTIPEGSDYVYDETDQFSEYIEGTDANKVRYEGYLGVIKHGTPGFLSEGYFHTYQVARHRYMNPDVCHLEGEAYAYGINDYFGFGYEEKEAVIYGILRDKDAKYSHEFYTPNVSTNDKYKPLNNAQVTLLDAAGNTVATYTTDDEYNGAFVFHVTPGTYSLNYAMEGYFAPDAEYTEQFTVAAGEKYYPEAFLRDTTWTPPTIVYVNYPDSTAGKGYKLLPKYETKASTYDLLATQLEGKAVRRQIVRDDKVYVLALDEANEPYIYIADLAGDSVITLDTEAVVMGGNGRLKISDIALTADHVLVASGLSKNQYSDDYVDDGEERGSVNFYKWTANAETGLPETCELWFTSDYCCNFYRGLLGKTIAYSGTIADGTLTASCPHGTMTSAIGMRIAQFAIVEGENTGAIRYDGWADEVIEVHFNADALSNNDDFELMVSPLGDNNNFVFDGNLIAPFEWTSEGDGSTPTVLGRNEKVASVKANGTNYFKYADRSFMVTPKVNADVLVEGIQLFDITDGFSNAKEIEVEAAIEPAAYTYASAHGELALELDAEDRTIGATIELFLVVDGKVTKFTAGDYYTTANLAKNTITGTANPFAYALKSEVASDVLNISYSLNTAATDVNIYVKNAAGETVATHAAGALEAGDYTAEITLNGLEEGDYTWEVEVAGAEKANLERFSTENFYHPSGLDVDNSFESGSFGTLFVTEGYNRGQTSGYVSAHADGRFGGGLYIFNPRGEQVLNKDGEARFYPSWLTNTDRTFGTKTCGGDFARVAIAEDGRIFVNRYNLTGDYYLYAESLEQLVADGDFTSLVAGKTMTDAIYYDESNNYLAGPAQGFDVKGSGEDLKLIAISRADNSVSTGQSLNRVVEYDLGTASALPTPTAYTALDKKYTISYDRKSNLQYDNQGGVWYIQYRGAPTDSDPALIYVDANGEIKYFEGEGGKARYQGAISVAPNGNRIVASSANGIVSVYDITRTDDGSVFLNEVYRLTHNMGGSAYSAAWDAAGNFYLGNATNEVVQGYAVPRTAPAVTKAASKYAFTVGSSGIETVGAANEDVPAVYYNLQGVQVTNPSNGIYIVKRGNKVTKEYIRK